MSNTRNPALLVFSDDWGRHPSSCQYLISQLLPHYRVWWVNTIGTRRPRLDVSTLRRGWKKLRQWGGFSTDNDDNTGNLRVLNPRMWPWFSARRDRRINCTMLLRQLKPVVESISEPVIAVTTLPIVADLVGDLPVDRWVYYCVDDFGQWPGLDQDALREMEAELIRQADVLIAVSENLRQRISSPKSEVHLLTHGVDLPQWSPGGSQQFELDLEGLERPLVVFWGMIDRRMDVDFVSRLAADLERGTIVLVGPESDPDPTLSRLTRVARLGPVEFAELPHLAEEAAVLIMPYADLSVTRAIQPLKMKEYLATGKPVVASSLPATRDWADCMDLVQTPDEFSQRVRLRLAEGLPTSQQQARRRLERESWADKARQFERIALRLEDR